jgi:hypothetical protein
LDEVLDSDIAKLNDACLGTTEGDEILLSEEQQHSEQAAGQVLDGVAEQLSACGGKGGVHQEERLEDLVKCSEGDAFVSSEHSSVLVDERKRALRQGSLPGKGWLLWSAFVVLGCVLSTVLSFIQSGCGGGCISKHVVNMNEDRQTNSGVSYVQEPSNKET